MSNQIKGVVYQIKDEQQISEKFRKQEIIIEVDDEKYPQFLIIQFVNDIIDNNLNGVTAGARVVIDYNLRGRLWTSPQGEEKCFNTLEGWRLKINNPTFNTTPAPVQSASDNSEQDDLPF